MDCSLPGSSVHWILQARILECLPCPSPGDLPDPRIEPVSAASPALQVVSLLLSHQGSPRIISYSRLNLDKVLQILQSNDLELETQNLQLLNSLFPLKRTYPWLPLILESSLTLTHLLNCWSRIKILHPVNLQYSYIFSFTPTVSTVLFPLTCNWSGLLNHSPVTLLFHYHPIMLCPAACRTGFKLQFMTFKANWKLANTC